MAAQSMVFPPGGRASEHPRRAHNNLIASMISGQLAGLVMMGALSLSFALLRGLPYGYALQAAAAVFLGDRALDEASPGPLFLGAVAHQLGPALFWSLVFGLIAGPLDLRRRSALALSVGLVLGALAMVVDVYLLLPLVARALGGDNGWTESVPRLWDWTAHLLYGGALGFFFVDRRERIARGPAAQRG